MSRLKQIVSVAKILLIFGALVFCITLVGCGSVFQTTEDQQWADGQLRSIVKTTHYSPPSFSFGYTENSRKMTGQKWNMVAVPSPNPSRQSPKKNVFLRLGGQSKEEVTAQTFSLIRGTNLLIHHFLTDGWVLGKQQFTVFDPKTGKDISNPFPPSPATCVFNRSGTICLTSVEGNPLTSAGGNAVIVNVLSAQNENPKVFAIPRWFGVSRRLEWEGQRALLTDDAQYLVWLPNIEVWSTNGNRESWSVPLDRKVESFVDAESVDGQVLFLSRSADVVKLRNIKGETILSTNIPNSAGVFWDSSHHEIFFSPACIWNYKSNSIQNVSVSPAVRGN